MVAPGCSRQQSQSTPEAQSQNVPAVGSLDDYLAQSSNSYMYASYCSYDPFMIDPFWFAPYWYPAPVHYYLPVGWHHEPMGFGGFGGGHMRGGRR